MPGPVGHLGFSDILDTSLKVSWREPLEKNGILTGKGAPVGTWLPHRPPSHLAASPPLVPFPPFSISRCSLSTVQHLPPVPFPPGSISSLGPLLTLQHLPLVPFSPGSISLPLVLFPPGTISFLVPLPPSSISSTLVPFPPCSISPTLVPFPLCGISFQSPSHPAASPLAPVGSLGWAVRGADGAGHLAGYRISWEEYNRTNTRVTHYLPNVTLEYRVTGLTALTTYTIEVAAMTSKGQGQVSSSTISSGVPPGERGGAGVPRGCGHC